MPKSLAELRAEPPAEPAERAYTVCLRPHLVAEVQTLTDELDTLPDATTDDGEQKDGPPKRMGQGEHPRAVEIQNRLAELLAEMAEYEGELRVKAKRTDGEWRQWVNAHPARGEKESGFRRDQQVTMGYCNADDLIDDLATYVHSWNGDPLTEADWGTTITVGNADKKHIATLVVSMYESDLSLPKWRSALSANLPTGNASSSPANSASVNDDSSAGSPTSDTSTTTQTES